MIGFITFANNIVNKGLKNISVILRQSGQDCQRTKGDPVLAGPLLMSLRLGVGRGKAGDNFKCLPIANNYGIRIAAIGTLCGIKLK